MTMYSTTKFIELYRSSLVLEVAPEITFLVQL